MRGVKVWVLAAILVAMFVGVIMVGTGLPGNAQQVQITKDHWRYSDGHWNYWNAADKRWYYTDGQYWYYNDNDAWQVYPFDRQFGREGFERDVYKAPGVDVKVNVPRHGVYRPK